MSVLDQVRALEQQVLQRLRELRPLIDEYRDLEKVAERLGLKRDDEQATDAGATAEAEPTPRRKPAAKRSARRAVARAPKPTAAAKAKPKAESKAKAESGPKPAASAKPKPTAARRSKAKPKPGARKRSAAAPGQREQDVLRLIGERPGVTVAELAAELEVEATGLYGVVRRLQGKGQIVKDGTQLRPADTFPSAADDPQDAETESPAGREEAPVPNEEGSDQAVAQPAGAAVTAEESS